MQNGSPSLLYKPVILFYMLNAIMKQAIMNMSKIDSIIIIIYVKIVRMALMQDLSQESLL